MKDPIAEVTDLNISWNFMSRDGIRKLTRHIKAPFRFARQPAKAQDGRKRKC